MAGFFHRRVLEKFCRQARKANFLPMGVGSSGLRPEAKMKTDAASRQKSPTPGVGEIVPSAKEGEFFADGSGLFWPSTGGKNED